MKTMFNPGAPALHKKWSFFVCAVQDIPLWEFQLEFAVFNSFMKELITWKNYRFFKDV